MQVDQARADDQPVAVDDLGPGRVQARPDLGHPAVVDQHVGGPVVARRRVDEAALWSSSFSLVTRTTSGPPSSR